METVLEKLKRSKKNYFTPHEIQALGLRSVSELRVDRWRGKGITYQRVNKRVVKYERVEIIRFLEKGRIEPKN